MTTRQTRGAMMADYARAITDRLADADSALRLAAGSGDTGALLIGMAEREASLEATEDLVGELDLAGLSSVEHAAIIRQMVQALERSQVAQAALEAELFESRRAAVRALREPVPPVRGTDRVGYALPTPRRGLRSTG